MGRKRTGSARYEKGRWYAFIRDAEGKRKRVPLRWTRPEDEKKAKADALEAAEHSARRALAEAPPGPKPGKKKAAPLDAYARVLPDGRETLAGWLRRWLDDREGRRSLRSVDTDRARARVYVLPAIGRLAVSAVSRADVEALVEALDKRVREDTCSWRTAQHAWVLVKRAFRDARGSKNKDLRARADDPTDGVEGPDRGASKLKVYLLPREASALLACDAVPVAARRLYAVAMYTGLRRGELQALAPADVRADAGYVVVHKAASRAQRAIRGPKTQGSVRRVPIEPAVAPLLARLVDEATSAGAAALLDVPPNRRLAHLLRRHLGWAAVDRPELFASDDQRRQLTFHDLRATCATWQALRGDDPLRIQRRLGHESLDTTQRYIREAEALGPDVGQPFPALPEALLGTPKGTRDS